MNLQASELLKIAFILYFFISRKLPQVREKIKVSLPTIIVVYLFLLLLQGDIGQTLSIMILLFHVYFAGIGVQK